MDPNGTAHAVGASDAFGERAEHAPIRRMRYQEVFEFAPDAQFVTDRVGVILEANHAAAILLGCPKEFLIGKPLALFGAEGQRQRFYHSLHRLSSGMASDGFEMQICRRGGMLRDAIFTARAGDWDEKLAFGRRLLWIARDITEQRQAEADRAGLLLRLATAEEDERRRLSRDLHDHLGQTATALILGIQTVRSLESLPPEASERLGRLQQLADELGRQVHDIAVRLRPAVLDDLGLDPALRELVAEWSIRTGVTADYQSSGIGSERFPAELESILFRVVQEALTNVARHAKASRVSVVVARRDGEAIALVEDDGQGFDPRSQAEDSIERLGLIGMRERVGLAGGSLEIESTPGEGTTIYARIPLYPP